MAAVRSLRVSLSPRSGSERSDSKSDSESDQPMEVEEVEEVEEGELEPEPEDVSVKPSVKELLPDTSRRYENKAGAFITGIDVNSKEAIEKKEKRARRFHFQGEESTPQRNFCLDRESIKKAIPRVRLEALHVSGVDDMSTQDVFGYFREYPPAHIEWIDDTSCNVVWLDEDTCIRALINTSQMPLPLETVTMSTDGTEHQLERSKGQRSDDDDEEEVEEEGEVEEDLEKKKETLEPEIKQEPQSDDLSGAERESLMRNELRPAVKPFKGNKLMLRFATQDDKKEPGAARRSRYYMKYGNPNYGGMKGILSNSWKRRYHNRRIQRDVLKSKKPLIGDSLGHTPPYSHRHSAELVNLPEEPIKEEEEDEDEEDMDADERVVEYRERERERERGERDGIRGRHSRTPSPTSRSSSDDMDYDLELKMISTPSPKKSKKMTMYADEVDTHLKSIRNRLGGGAPHRKSPPPAKVTDVRQLLEEKRQRPPQPSSGKTDVRRRLGKRRYSPDRQSLSPDRDPPPEQEPIRDVHSRLGVAKEKKTGGLWSRLGPPEEEPVSIRRTAFSSVSTATRPRKPRLQETDEEEASSSSEGEEQEEDSRLQRVWGAMIKRKQSSHKNMKKSRLDNLPSLQIEISRDTTDESDN